MKQFEIKEKQDEINKIDYWDGCVLDLQILYFGDEVHMYLEEYRENTCSLEECWKLSFIGCADVSYETDARERRTFKVKDFKKTQLYTCQDILLRYHDETFMKCTIVLEGLVILNIICRDIIVEKNNISNQDFFGKITSKFLLRNVCESTSFSSGGMVYAGKKDLMSIMLRLK